MAAVILFVSETEGFMVLVFWLGKVLFIKVLVVGVLGISLRKCGGTFGLRALGCEQRGLGRLQKAD